MKTEDEQAERQRVEKLADTFAGGEFLRVGRRVVAVELRAWQPEDRLVASGRAHLMIA